MSRRGPKKINERIPIAKMIKAYERYRTVRAASRALGVSHVALLNALKKEGVKIRSRAQANKEAARSYSHHGSFSQWLINNGNNPLPRSIPKLIELSGCTRDSITCYLYRRRKEIKELLKSTPDLRKVPAVLEDQFGMSYSTKDMVSYEYMLDKFSLKVDILAKLKEDGRLIEIPVQDVQKFVTSAKKLIPRLPPASSSQQERPAKDHPYQDSPKISEHNGPEDFQETIPGS